MTDRYQQDEIERRQNAVDIARLQVKVDHLTEALAAMTTAVAALTKKVEEISETLTEAKGGWRMLMLVGGAAGSVGAALAWIISHVSPGAPAP